MVYVLIESEVIINISFIEYTIIFSILLFSRLENDVLFTGKSVQLDGREEIACHYFNTCL